MLSPGSTLFSWLPTWCRARSDPPAAGCGSGAGGDKRGRMALYAFVALKYLYPLERMQQTVERHRTYLRELHARGKMVCSGPFVPRDGGAMLLRVESPSEIEPILAKDP